MEQLKTLVRPSGTGITVETPSIIVVTEENRQTMTVHLACYRELHNTNAFWTTRTIGICGFFVVKNQYSLTCITIIFPNKDYKDPY